MDTSDTSKIGGPDWAAQLAAAQAWWRDAGVDLTFADSATDWLASARAKAAASSEPAVAKEAAGVEPPPPPPPRIGGDRAHWPATLEAFGDWWLTEPSLDPAPAAQRVLPAGPKGAPLMIVVPMPEPEDDAVLLSGPQGRLLDAILVAFGFRREEIYLASVLPRPVAAPDWPALAAAGLADVLAHHIALAAPQRLFAFGRDISSLLGHDPAQAAQSSLTFNHEGTSVPLAVAPALEALLQRPALKRGLWSRWLDWTGTG
jgi:DNA polymerase